MTLAALTLFSIPVPSAIAWVILRLRGVSQAPLAGRLGLAGLLLPMISSGRWAFMVVEDNLIGGLGIFFASVLASFALLLAVLYDVDRFQRSTTWSRSAFTMQGTADFALQFLPLAWVVLLGVGLTSLGIVAYSSWWVLPLAISTSALVLTFLTYPVICTFVIRAKPFPGGSLLVQLEMLARSSGVGKVSPYLFPGRTGRIITAWTAGILGRGRRVFLSDALADTLSNEELLAVYAHELGHVKLNHLWMNLGVAVINLVLLLVAIVAVVRVFPGRIPPAITGVIGGAFGFLGGIPSLALMRRNELAADRFAAQLTGNPEALAGALERLELPMKPRGKSTARGFESLWRTHPPIEDRINALRRLGT